jgi:hypothetical protein
VDLLEFLVTVTSIPCQNNVLSLSIIPKATERETIYKLSYDDLRKAVNHLCKIQQCGSADCEYCIRIRELLSEKNIVDYIASNEFKQQKMPVQTSMSDNFQGFSNFCRAEFGIDPILCKPHATGKALCCICQLCLFLILSPAGIAASQYSHVKYFPNQDAYNEYYDFVVDICDIRIESFATSAQTMLVDHLCKHYGDGIANWCKTFWTEARGRMCLAHSRYSGCNNNMGIEVFWRDIKKLLPPNSSLGQFLGALCNYIKTALGEEHMQRLCEVCSGNPFIQEPIATKDMWDGVQSAHSKTLSCSFVLTTASKRANVAIESRDMMEEIMECGQRKLALHLKIAAWHEDIRRMGQCQRLALGNLKTILVPRQALLKRLDPTGELSVPTLRTQLQPLVRKYERLVIQDRVDADNDLRDALKIYNYFHQLNRAPDWGAIPLSCTCRVCFGNCVCKHTLLFVSLFKPEVRVPDFWIAATPSLRKKCKSIKGTAGRRRLRLIEEGQCDEKSIDSKVSFLKGSAPHPFRPAGWIPALLLSSVFLPRSCRPLRPPSMTMMTFRLRHV